MSACTAGAGRDPPTTRVLRRKCRRTRHRQPDQCRTGCLRASAHSETPEGSTSRRGLRSRVAMCAAAQTCKEFVAMMAHAIDPACQIGAFIRGHAGTDRSTVRPACPAVGNRSENETGTMMKNSLIRKELALAISCALALGFGSGAASAQEDPTRLGYVQDPRGAIVTSGSGLCWHTGAGPTPQSTLECDPNYVTKPLARVEQPVPPVAAAAPTPAPTPAPMPAAQPIALVQPCSRGGRQAARGFDADALFDFDKSFLRSVHRLHWTSSSASSMTSSRKRSRPSATPIALGSIGYNQRLSEERVKRSRPIWSAKVSILVASTRKEWASRSQSQNPANALSRKAPE